LGKELNLSTEETAEGILRVVNASMANAIRELTVSRGIDPRDYTLVAFGGAGPLHAVEIAEHLQLTKVIVPLNPGVLSAWGMLHADSRLDSVMSYFINLKSLDEIKLQETLSQLSSIGIEGLLNASILLDNIITRPAADLRYRGQEYTVTIEWPTQWSAREIIQNLGKLFEEEHLIRYGHNNEGEEIEIVNIRVGAIGITKKNETFSIKNFTVAEEIPSQKVFFTDDWAQTSIIRRENIKLEVEIKGPAIIVENDCTTTLPPGWKAELTEFGHLILEKND
jgi:N-methylhydantoinase A